MIFVSEKFDFFLWKICFDLMIDRSEEVVADWRVSISFEKSQVSGDADDQRRFIVENKFGIICSDP